MSQNLSSAAVVIGALRVNIFCLSGPLHDLFAKSMEASIIVQVRSLASDVTLNM